LIIWRLQDRRHPLINSEGAKLTGGRWNQPGTPVIYASENIILAAMELMVHHGGIPEDYIAIKIEIPDDLEIGTLDIPDHCCPN
jgi:RES domain-containing protein